jgi:aryl-alcohol dehydrogenase-like predicted oxidoreductase
MDNLVSIEVPDLSKIALGAVQFGANYGISNQFGQTPVKEVSRILKLAEAQSIHFIDTSYNYGNSESVLGANPLSSFNIVSKFPLPPKNGALIEILTESLQRLNVDNIYGWLCHEPDKLIENPSFYLDAKEIQRNGLVKKVGVSVYTPQQLSKIISLTGVPDIVQVPFNILDQRFEAMLVELKAAGTEIHVRSAFLQGLLLMSPNELPTFFQPLKAWLFAFNEAFSSIELKINAALKFCLNHPAIDKTVIGVNTCEQLKMNISALTQKESSLPPIPNDLPLEIIMPSMWPKSN